MARALSYLLPIALMAAPAVSHAQERRGESPRGESRRSESQGPVDRAGRISAIDGPLSLRVAGEQLGPDAQINFPIITGAELTTGRDSLAEAELGGAVIALDKRTAVTIDALDDEKTELTLRTGSMDIRVHTLTPDEHISITTPKFTVVLLETGSYRIDVDSTEATRLDVFDGKARVETAAGWHTFNADEGLEIDGRRAVPVHADGAPIDDWAAKREDRRETSVSARYVSTDIPGYEALDAAGTWQSTAEYGPVWTPTAVGADWAPYQNGRWSWVQPWGWTWVDSAAWGFAPFHYGRWVFVDDRWAWSPGKRLRYPVYMPAAVGFDGVVPTRFASPRQPPLRWVALAPGEVYRAPYSRDTAYLRKVNTGSVAADTLASATWETDEWPAFTNMDHVRVGLLDTPRAPSIRSRPAEPEVSGRAPFGSVPPSAPASPALASQAPPSQVPVGPVTEGLDSQGRMVLHVPVGEARRLDLAPSEEIMRPEPDHLTHPELADRSHLVDPLPAAGALVRAPVKQEQLEAAQPTQPPLSRPVHSVTAKKPAAKPQPQASASSSASSRTQDTGEDATAIGEGAAHK